MKTPRIGILAGPTATGKTALALELAREHGRIEIINADSLLVYREMNIGTAKPTVAELDAVPHHLVNIVDPSTAFTAGEFYRAAIHAISEIEGRGNRALIVGGTGFYLKALLFGLWPAPPSDPDLKAKLSLHSNTELFVRLESADPVSARRIGAADRYRLIRALEVFTLTGKTPTDLQALVAQEPDPRWALWVVDRPAPELNSRVTERAVAMLQSGLIEETRALLAKYPDSRALAAVGYAQVIAYLRGESPAGRKISPGLAGLQDEIELATRQLIKRQRTFFRGQKSSLWFQLDHSRNELIDAFKEIYC